MTEESAWTIGDCECGNVIDSHDFDKPCSNCATFHYAKVEVCPLSRALQAEAERDEAIKEREQVWAINQDLASDATLIAAITRAQAAEERLARVEGALSDLVQCSDRMTSHTYQPGDRMDLFIAAVNRARSALSDPSIQEDE